MSYQCVHRHLLGIVRNGGRSVRQHLTIAATATRATLRTGLRSHTATRHYAVATTFDQLKIPQHWLNQLQRIGITSPTETQLAAMPPILGGKHVVLKAETGSGKTLCYLLPILEAVRARWLKQRTASGDDSDHSPSATAVIVVPTQELVNQIIHVANSLSPDTAHLFRAVYADKGVSRREDVGCIVATPIALKENVNVNQLSGLKYIVLDECDMLLSGSYLPVVQGYLLAMFKQAHPDLRPQHIFCAATIPSKGKLSPQAFLDTYYPPEEVIRVSTGGAHRALPTVKQLYWQLDTDLPLTLEEQQAKKKVEEHLKRTVTELHGGVESQDGEIEVIGDSDVIGEEMEKRRMEDFALALKADNEVYMTNVANIRNHALLAALLLPTCLPASHIAPVRTKHSRQTSTLLVGHKDAEASSETESSTPMSKHDAPLGATASDLHEIVPKGIVPFRPQQRLHRLFPDDISRVPPTIIFWSSAEAAEQCRKFLLTSCPGLGVGELHKRVSEDERAGQLSHFKQGRYKVLVCTDIASRGLDTLHVEHVIQAEFASDVVTHLHRIGRTARAGRGGYVTNLLLRRNLPLANALLQATQTGKPIDDAFSRRRSFRKELKRSALRQAEETALQQAVQGEGASTTTA